MTEEEALKLIRDYEPLITIAARQAADGRGYGYEEDARSVIVFWLWRHLPRYDPARAKVSTWIFRIIKSAALQFRRSRVELVVRVPRRFTGQSPTVVSLDSLDGFDPPARDEDADTVDGDVLSSLLEAVQPEQREFLLAVYRDGVSAVAAARGVTKQAVYARRDVLIRKIRSKATEV